jgi:hypothetical protein
MKSFFTFLSEATQSQASQQAQKMGLKGDGHGGWLDRSGKVVARTDKGKLKFIDGRQAAGAQEPAAAPRQSGAAPMPQQPQGAQAPAPAAPQAPGAAPQDQEQQQELPPLTVVFGRFNPPTVGHEKLLKSAKRISAGGDIKIYPSRSQDPKKNPLDPNKKVSFMKRMFPEFKDNIINDDEMKTIFNVLVSANEDGYTSVNIVVGSDRQAEFENLAQKYNGDLYTFDQIRVISAGVRDADAEGVEGMSASKMRKAVMDNDFASFRRGTPKTLDDGDTQTLFDAVRQGMGAKKASKVKKESYNLWEIAPKCDMRNLRENYVRGRIFRIGDKVENLNTGLIGEVMRRGTNHLICVTEEGYMFKSWIKDLMEYTEVKMDSPMRDKTHPNTLVGTLGAFKHYAKMTPGVIGTNSQYLQKGGKAYGVNFINKYKAKKASTY